MKNLIDSFSYPEGIFLRGTRIVFVSTLIILMLIRKSIDSFDGEWAIFFLALYFLEEVLIHYQQRLFGDFWGSAFFKQYPHWWTPKLLAWTTGALLIITHFYSLYLLNNTVSTGWMLVNVILWWVFIDWVARKIGSKLASIRYTNESDYPHYQHFYTG